MLTFAVTYEIVTPESADYCDVEDSGFVAQGVGLREALDLVGETESCHCERSCVEPSDNRVEQARWFTVYNSADYISGEVENRSLHIPEGVTASSRRRIARLLGVAA